MKLTPALNNRGFSLVEVIIAIFLIGAMVVVIANIPQAVRLITLSKSESIVREVAAKKLEDMRLTGYENLPADGVSNFSDPKLSSLAGVSATSDVVVCPAALCPGGEAVKHITISISWNEGPDRKNFELETLIGQGGIK